MLTCLGDQNNHFNNYYYVMIIEKKIMSFRIPSSPAVPCNHASWALVDLHPLYYYKDLLLCKQYFMSVQTILSSSTQAIVRTITIPSKRNLPGLAQGKESGTTRAVDKLQFLSPLLLPATFLTCGLPVSEYDQLLINLILEAKMFMIMRQRPLVVIVRGYH